MCVSVGLVCECWVSVSCCAAKDTEGQGEEGGEKNGREAANGTQRTERQVRERERETGPLKLHDN